MKRVMSLLLSVVMILCVNIGFSINVQAATNKTKSEAVSWANSQVGSTVGSGQCVALIKAYYEYLGVSSVTGNGCDYATNSLPAGWSRIKYSSGFSAQPGDIAVWTYLANSYGHVAIVTSANTSSMNVIDQGASYGYKTKQSTFAYSRGTFWGVIRPNFKSEAQGNMTTPTITLDRSKAYYYVGDTVNIKWVATSSNTDFYQYWVIIKNTTTNKQCYGGDANSTGNVSKNSYSYKVTEAGEYSISVCAVPKTNKESRQKFASKTFSVNKTEMSNPNIYIDKTYYKVGEKVNISWDKSNNNSDFYQYWLIIKNTDTNKTLYGDDAESTNNSGVNTYSFTATEEGNYKITVYSVPYYNKDSRQKACTKIFTVCNHNYTASITKAATCGATGTRKYTCSKCNSYYTETIPATGKHSYNNGVVTKKATYSEAGIKTYTCNGCGRTYTESIPKLIKNGWITENGNKYYYKNEEALKGVQRIDNKTYVFAFADGRMLTGWISVDGKKYYLGNDGGAFIYFKNINGKNYYFNGAGVMSKNCWLTLNGKKYYFGSDGAAYTYRKKIGNYYYYFNGAGVMATGWIKGGTWMYAGTNGALKTGWQKINNVWYYFKADGSMVTGWQKIAGKWYYFNSSGSMRTANLTQGGKTYRFNSSGACINP